ncbi:MAG: glucosamine-6-phosphate deaminase [Oscillospiraceae bacterium]|jgi:glucosamine-6-phosphate deaminase|nr:glucosamine-6-phosphate deaminase [Oscillospiraceae bacterium]
MIKKIVCEDYAEICRVAADIYVEQLKRKPDSVLGLATGSTPIGLYAELVRRFQNGEIDFSQATSFNLDEYYPIKKSHPQSYDYFMRDNLFDKVNFKDTVLHDGEAVDPMVEGTRYDARLKEAGGIDLMLLGIGLNGHIGFNEPAASYPMGTYLVELSESSLEANSRFFGPDEIQPTTALTLGVDGIFNSKKIIMLITGKGKAEIVKKLFEGKIHTDVPACFLLLHPNVTVILDKAANGE